MPEGRSGGNRLANELSPYLLQHAHNPVDWYAWGELALARAEAEQKPIFLSIGYSTCHWCHVMERESFENETIAELMNRHFVAIKVDREERPDLDDIYMNACQLMTGRGGWPLSVFLLPDRRPFLAGTYFPPEDRHGMRGFRSLLTLVAEAWRDRREEVTASAEQLHGYLAQLGNLPEGPEKLGDEVLESAYAELCASYDPKHGGFGPAPKFPRPDFGTLCLRRFHRRRDEPALRMARHTLDRMAAGGMYDQLGGGFHRYSTDAQWLAPHFEKMLYDNAQLALHYTEAYQLTDDVAYARVVRETLDYLLRDMRDGAGGFYSAEDADSEGEEGTFYVWSLEQIRQLLSQSELDLFADAYDLSAGGNWEGHNILRRVRSAAELAARHGQDAATIEQRLSAARSLLLLARSQRVRPGRDEKVLAGWNGLAIGAFARAAVVLDEARYLDAAQSAADFVLAQMHDGKTLLRRWCGGQAGIAAFAEDYSFLIAGLLELYQANLEPNTLRNVLRLQAEQLRLFLDAKDGALFQSVASASDLIVRVKAGHDGSLPTANSVAARNLIRLGEISGDPRWLQCAERILNALAGTLRAHPMALTHLLLALDEWQAERIELVLAGPRQSQKLRGLLQTARQGFQPDLSIGHAPGDEAADLAAELPALADKGQAKAPTAYVCRAWACQAPTDQAAELVAQIAASRLG